MSASDTQSTTTVMTTTPARHHTELFSTLSKVGNLVHENVPSGANEDKNVVRKTHGEFVQADIKTSLHHHELLYRIGGYDPARGSKVAGHRGYFLQGNAARLQLAIVSYGIDFLAKRGFQAMYTPFQMLKEPMACTAQLEDFDEELYKVSGNGDEETYLIATSEQPLSAYHRNEWLGKDELPLKYAGQSTNFRKEAGKHGKDAWGIFRVHQFDKVEQFVLCSPNDNQSWELQKQMLQNAEDFYQTMNIPYRVVDIVAGALNNAAARKFDLEAWFPTLGTFRELVSCSNCTDYQSRSLEVRFGHSKKGPTKTKEYVHMLNSTLVATTRLICCLLELNQTPEGVVVPEVLRPYMGGLEIMPFVRDAMKRSKDMPAAKPVDPEAIKKWTTVVPEPAAAAEVPTKEN